MAISNFKFQILNSETPGSQSAIVSKPPRVNCHQLKPVVQFALLLAAFLALGAMEPRPQPKPLEPAEGARQGRALAAEILDQLSRRPAEGLTNTGVLNIREAKGGRVEIPFRFQIATAETASSRWSSDYETTGTNRAVKLTVLRATGQPNAYRLVANGATNELAGNQAMLPFAGSDFWAADLGLEFFSWPGQQVLFTEQRRGRWCRVLESVNPQPAKGAYSRVVSWIDRESLGIIYAEAYDAENKLLKEFVPKEVRKVNGEWQLEEMEMANRQTGSRTLIEFHFETK